MSSEERGDSTGTIAAVCGVGVCGGVCMCVVWVCVWCGGGFMATQTYMQLNFLHKE